MPLLRLSLGLFLASCLLASDLQARPSIIVIVADDLGYSDLGCYGGEIRTPHLDRLAAEGLRFTRFTNNAKCTQTRAALLSGLYHHQTGQDLRRKNHVTLAETLREQGYRTLMSGKWHLSGTPPDRGFDRFFGFLGGAVDFFSGLDFATGKNLMRLDREVFEVKDERFYTTDAFTDRAIEFIDEALEGEEPFFLYLAHNAPHFPLQAWPEDIARYRDTYREGWDVIRKRRHARQLELGVIPGDCRLSPRDPRVPAWETLSPREKSEQALLMAVYAAMVDRLDQNIGRLLTHLERREVARDTLVLFFSDNGGCPYDFNRTPDLPPGPRGSRRSYDSEWANVSNTPFRLYKQWAHEGGIATPFIAHWPAGIERRGERVSRVSHLIDLYPTILEITGASQPREWPGRELLPLEGESFLAALRSPDSAASRRQKPLFFEYQGNRAVIEGEWKLVAERSRGWELYHLGEDRAELRDRIGEEPERARAMARLYDAWAERTGARSDAASRRMKPSTQER